MKECDYSAEQVCAILVESTMRIISVKLLLNFERCLENRCCLKIFKFSTWVANLFIRAKRFGQYIGSLR